MLDSEFWKREQDALEQAIIPILVTTAVESAQAQNPNADAAEIQSAALDWAATHAPQLAKDITKNSRDAIEKAVEANVPLNEVLDSILGDNRAELIAITETTRAISRGTVAASPIKEFQWHTANDELVCEICDPLNDAVRKEGEPFGEDYEGLDVFEPPVHPRCRCAITPHVRI